MTSIITPIVESQTGHPPKQIASSHGKMPQHPVLDGWRAISILVVLAAHMLPLGPKRFDLNASVGALGMSLFFTLSGFLITKTLIYRPSVPQFLIRRFCRILPLAWLFMLVALPLARAPFSVYVGNFLFFANLPPFFLTDLTGHLWSLCVEMQFYVAVACLVGVLGRRGIWGIPVLCVAITAARAWTGTDVSIVTYLRADEILVGGCLALNHEGWFGAKMQGWLGKPNRWLLAIALMLSSLSLKHSVESYHWPVAAMVVVTCLRPYLAATLIGTTLTARQSRFHVFLAGRKLKYIAEISYALYVIHPLTMHGWLGSGGTMVRYAKRPLSFVLTFALAHLSTRYYESRWIEVGKRWASRVGRKTAVSTGRGEREHSVDVAIPSPVSIPGHAKKC